MANTPYQESEDHVPDPTSQTGTLDTSGTAGAGHNDMSLMTPVFDDARRQELESAQRALDPKDLDVPANLVVIDEKIAPGHGQQIASERIANALDEADSKAEVRYGTPEWFEQNTGTDAPRGSQVAGVEGEDGGGAIAAPVNTDLTGTLDTSGTAGTGHPDASTISAAAQMAKAEGKEGSDPTDSPNQESAKKAKAATKKSSAKKKAAPRKKAAAKKAAAPKKEAASKSGS